MPKEPTILVLGASGMLGQAVQRKLSAQSGWTVDSTQRQHLLLPDYLDILRTPPDHIKALLDRRSYDYIVNCVGILASAVDQRDSESIKQAIRVNSLFPHDLASLASNARILHMSTDGVFSGRLGRPYRETDSADCDDLYGKTKALGECPAVNVINLRCSVIGRDSLHGRGFVEWVLRSQERAELTGFDDQSWNGVTSEQFAELCRRIIASDSFAMIRNESGVHHFCPNPLTTKYSLMCAIRDISRQDIVIHRGSSKNKGTRTLSTIFSSLTNIYPEHTSWNTLIGDLLANSKGEIH